MNPQVDKTIQHYDKIAEKYSQINFQPEFWFDEFKIYKTLLPGKKILDVGCGSGRDAVLFTQNKFDYTGIDGSSGMLAVAKAKAPKAKFIKSSFNSLNRFKNYDGFWAAASLLHIPKVEIKSVLISLGKTIKPTGAGFISMKPKEGNVDESFVQDQRYDGLGRFFAYYTPTEFKEILNDCGFEVIKSTKKLEMPDNKVWLCFFVKK
ncbi:MAG TPA: methyltransferase domain-containing protein [Candidatus Paceibacterota bacterium]